MNAKIMFVDDDASVLDSLRRQLWRHSAEWELYWAANATAALDQLSRAPVDVIVTDMQMPGMSGAELLERVRALYPSIGRLVLSGHADPDAIIAAAGPTQQYLSKPCTLETLEAALTSALRALHLMESPNLRSLIGSLASLPKPPRIYVELTALLSRSEITARDVSRVLQQDVACTAEVLKLVNSSFFSLATDVVSIERAVVLLGLDVIKALVLAGSLFTPSEQLPCGLDAAAVANQAVSACLAARRIAQGEGWDGPTVNHLGLAALLHDVGLLVLASAYPDRWGRLAPQEGPASERERQTVAFGCTIGQSSAYLLELWGFPREVVAALALCPVDLSAPAERATASPATLALAVARHLTAPSPTAIPADDGADYLHTRRLQRWEQLGLPPVEADARS